VGPDRRLLLTAVAAGGFAGAIARTALAETWPVHAGTWPWATFAANVAGAFLLGWLVAWLRAGRPQSRYLRPLLGTGFCGALTTFSTLQLELLRMLDRGDLALAAGYLAACLACGLAAVRLAVARALAHGRGRAAA
jgi:CrcB protein